MVLQVRVDWAGPQVRGGGISLLHFNNLIGDAQACCDATEDFLTALASAVNQSHTATISNQVSQFDGATGDLVSVVSVSSPGPQNMSNSGAALPPSSQGPLALITDGIKNNRIVRGRFFVPAPTETNNDSDGTTSTAYVSDVEGAANALIADATAQWSVWSRPVAGSGGSVHSIVSAEVRADWWVLRSRRD